MKLCYWLLLAIVLMLLITMQSVASAKPIVTYYNVYQFENDPRVDSIGNQVEYTSYVYEARIYSELLVLEFQPGTYGGSIKEIMMVNYIDREIALLANERSTKIINNALSIDSHSYKLLWKYDLMELTNNTRSTNSLIEVTRYSVRIPRTCFSRKEWELLNQGKSSIATLIAPREGDWPIQKVDILNPDIINK